MCCTAKEMAAEGRKMPTDQWFTVQVRPCCVPLTPPTTEAQREQRRGGMDTGIQCGRCANNTFRLLRTVKKAEQHEGQPLEVTLAELACPCGNLMVMAAEALERLAARRGVDLHVT